MTFRKLLVQSAFLAATLSLIGIFASAQAQDITIDPMAWDFGNVETGQSAIHQFTIQSSGPSELTILAIELRDQDLNPYVGLAYEISGAPVLPTILPIGETIELDVTFAPPGVGLYLAKLYIASNAPISHHYLDLSGRGISVDLSAWTAESYPAVAGYPPGAWQVAVDNLSVTQVNNGQPTVFYSDGQAFDTSLEGEITVLTSGDDDYIGFVIGFEPGDTGNPGADYLLVDWKQSDQFHDFGSPSHTTPGSTAFEGLAVSRVSGIPTADEFWGHLDFAENPSGGLEELGRGATLGSTGWIAGQSYQFDFDFTATRLRVSVDGMLELDVSGSFSNGRMGFYNFSQEDVRYSGFESGLSDIDGDGVTDDMDNCITFENPAQQDTNGDNIGNACDADLNGDCLVNFGDLAAFKAGFFPLYDPDADFDSDGSVNFGDLARLKETFFSGTTPGPGPSALPNACD